MRQKSRIATLVVLLTLWIGASIAVSWNDILSLGGVGEHTRVTWSLGTNGAVGNIGVGGTDVLLRGTYRENRDTKEQWFMHEADVVFFLVETEAPERQRSEMRSVGFDERDILDAMNGDFATLEERLYDIRLDHFLRLRFKNKRYIVVSMKEVFERRGSACFVETARNSFNDRERASRLPACQIPQTE